MARPAGGGGRKMMDGHSPGSEAATMRSELPALPQEMRGNSGRERQRHRFVTRTLDALAAGTAVSGDSAEDWRRTADQLATLWQMSRAEVFRLSVAELEQRARAQAEACAASRDEVARGIGPAGGELIHPWHAQEGDWVAVPQGPSGHFEQAVMTMPDALGVARTAVSIDQRHLFHHHHSHALHYLDADQLIERLPVAEEQAKANEQWEKDRQQWLRS
ncbi:hypothetical protein [Streptomyces sp. NPDC058268]|uniref:hypothetical protein n=1 Tax=Streptomyces sp. NPDC058268 TaxID=3346413 RepID=UPI0036E758F6